MSDTVASTFINAASGPLGGAEILQGANETDRKEVPFFSIRCFFVHGNQADQWREI